MVTPTTKTAMPTCARCMPKKLRGCLSAAARKERPARVHCTRSTKLSDGGADDPGRQQQAERGQRLTSCRKPAAAARPTTAAASQRPAQGAGQFGELGLLPARERADAHQEQHRRHQRHEHRVEVRRADRDLAEAQRVDQQRIQRAEQHRRRRRRPAARCWPAAAIRARRRPKRPPSADLGRAPGEQRQRAADHDDQEAPG